MPGTGSPTRYGPNWRRRFRRPHGGHYSASPPPIPVVGADQTAPWALYNGGFGPAYGFRGYNPPYVGYLGVPTSWPGDSVTIPPGVPASGTIVSFRPDIPSVIAGTLDTQLAAFFATVPAGAFVTAWHEGDINLVGASAAQIVAMHLRMYGLFNANAPASASYGQIVAAQSALPGNGGYPLGPWMSTPANGGVVLDFYGMDLYPNNAYITFAYAVGQAMSAMIAAGVPQAGPWTIAEVGWRTLWHGSEAQWYSDGWATAQAINAIHYLGFFSPTSPNSFVLTPSPDPNVLRVLQDYTAVSRSAPRSVAAGAIARSTQAAMVSSAGSTGLTATFSSNPTAGSKVLVTVQSAGGAATYTVTDNGATPSTFTLDACCLVNSSTIPSVYIYRADNITLPGSGTYAVSVTRSLTGPLQVAANAYTGVQNGPPTATSAVNGTSNNPAVQPVTPDDQTSLFYSAFFCDSAASPETFAVASPLFTLQQSNGTALTNAGPGAVADAIATTQMLQQGGFTLPDAPDWSMVMAAYSAFPAVIQIVPGAEMTWAQACDNTPQISVNAGVASASGWAAVNFPVATSPTASTATATGAALFSGSGSTVSLTLTAVNPVGAIATALDASTPPVVNVYPFTAVATGAALDTTPPAWAGLAAATGAALAPAATVAPTAGLAAATAVPAQPGLGFTPATATATGAALNATVPTGTNANAGLASATGAALGPVVTVAPTAATGAATGAALAPALGWTPATAAATGAAQAAQAVSGIFLRAVSADNSGSTSNTTITPTLPSGWQPGDLILIGGSTGGLPITQTGGTGTWTIFSADHISGTGTQTAFVAWRVMVSGDTAPTFTPAGSSVSWDACIALATYDPGMVLSVDVFAADLISSSGVNSFTPGAATAAGAGEVSVILTLARAFASGVATVTYTPPAGWTAPAGGQSQFSSAGSHARIASVAYQLGLSGTVTPAAETVTDTLSGVYSAAVYHALIQEAPPALLANAGLASGTGAALAPALGWTPALATGTGAGQQPTATVAPTAATGAATGAAVQPAVVTGVAPVAAVAAATGTANAPTATVTVTAGLASAAGAALAPALGWTPATAAATGAAKAPAPAVAVNAATGAATGAAKAPALGWTPALAVATGAAQGPALAILAQTAAAQALAAALNAGGVGVAAFTVGTLTAATAAAGTDSYPDTYYSDVYPPGPAGALTATDQRTGGPG